MGLIPEDVINQIRERSDIVAVIGQHVQLRKAGRSFKGLCPFHQEKSPSFNVNADKGFFYCFGCQKKGDVFTFVMEYEGKSFFEAAQKLAEISGVTLPSRDESPALARQRSERQRMVEVNAIAADFFRACLRDERRGASARQYLAERGIGDEVAEKFRLGLAPEDWRALTDHLAARKVPPELAVAVGLIGRQPRAGGYYDRFRNRLMCPVILAGGEVVGFSGRRLGEGEQAGAKYINSPESAVYKKSKLLFGIHRARDAFRRSGRAILVEGNFDVVSLHQAGLEETVAPLGTALTDEQVDQLRRLADQVVLVYDGDRAGRAATLKALEMLVGAGVSARIAALPMGEDPDTLVRRDPEHFATLVDRAQPWLEYFIYEVWSADSQTSEGWGRALSEAARIVAKVADPTKRDLITNTLAAKTGLEVGFVQRALARGAAATERGPEASDNGARPRAHARPTAPPPPDEVELLTLLNDHPALMELAEEHHVFSLLTDARLRDMYSAALRGQPLLSAAPEDLSPLIAQKVLSGSYASVKDPAHTLTEVVTRLKRITPARSRLAELQRQVEDARRRGDAALQRQLVLEILETKRQVD